MRARLAGTELPQVELPAPAASSQADAPDHAGAERIEPSVEAAAQIMDAALPAELAKPQPLLLIECGNFSHPEQVCPDIRALTHLKALQLAGCVAVVPGVTELQFKREHAAALFKDSPLPLVSCNLSVTLPEANLVPYVELAPGWYLTGVTAGAASEDPAAEVWWTLADAVASVRDVQAKLPQSSQLIVVAQNQPESVLRELAGLPVALVVGAKQDIALPQNILPAPPMKASSLEFASLKLEQGQTTVTPWSFELSDYWPDDPQIPPLFKEEFKLTRARILGIRASGGKEDWRKTDWGQSDKFLPPAGGAGAGGSQAQAAPANYLGPETCKMCHAQPYAAWQQSRHSHAMASLTEKGEQENLDCLKCHTTGFMQPAGYDPFTPNPALGLVSCESCHGPGSVHIGLMSGSAKPTAGQSLGIERGSLDACIACHDKYNSPEFAAQQYWEQIKH